MAKKPETVFWKWLQGKLLSECPGAHFSRIENSADPGTPDVSWSWDASEGFIELKWARRWPLGRDGLRPSQVIWIRKRLRTAGNVSLVIGTPAQVLVFSGTDLQDHLTQINKFPLRLAQKEATTVIDRRSPQHPWSSLLLCW